MGRFERAELSELIGIYIQSNSAKIISKNDMDLYRDGGFKGLKIKFVRKKTGSERKCI